MSEDREILEKVWSYASSVFEQSYEKKDEFETPDPVEREYFQGKADALRLILATIRDHPEFGNRDMEQSRKLTSGVTGPTWRDVPQY